MNHLRKYDNVKMINVEVVIDSFIQLTFTECQVYDSLLDVTVLGNYEDIVCILNRLLSIREREKKEKILITI